MTQGSDTPTADDTDIGNADSAPMFYVVSKRKFAILFLATMSLYLVYWFYKNWDRYKDKWPHASKFGSTIWPVPRAIFSIFFVHALFRKIKAHGQDNPAVGKWSNNVHATLIVLLMIVSTVFDPSTSRVLGSPFTAIGPPYGEVLSLALLVPLLFQFLKAQEMINISCGDPGGVSNSSFSKANYAWVVIGVLFWISAIIGILLSV
ncbi:hypothetical protein [Massilia horti]|uniref:DUF4234 domain-containing protein n=1 Tax=Massilia horti TaxID=2562153 RepID=A0A4Y9T6L3_9BURK|nr:hypothetical protein [Massilia horti]TFW36214.1 hypothetical protein E4O92_00480 [Massilia horti]